MDDSKGGIERDRQLLSVAVDVAPICMGRYPCLDDEFRFVRKLYPSVLKGKDRMNAFADNFLGRRDASKIEMLAELGDFSGVESCSDMDLGDT